MTELVPDAIIARGRNSRLGSGLAFAAAVLIVVALTGALHARTALTDAPPDKQPLTVAAVHYQVQDSYTRKVSQLGLVVAGRKAKLAFEVPGRIASLPLRQGSPVQAGDIIAQLDDATLQSRRRATAAELEQARAELELARLKANRQSDLQATGAVSREAFDETRLRARASAARVESVEARLESIDIELAQSRLVAPYAGIIADRYVDEGTVISPGLPVVRLLEIAGREAHIGVAAGRAGDLVTGRNYRLTLRGQAFEAPLLSVRPDVDPVTRVVTAVFAIPGRIDALDGEPVYLELDENVPLAGGWLPISALLEGQRGVWTVLRLNEDAGQTRTLREAVEVLDIRGDQAYVRGTLPRDSSVVASGIHRITPGTLVAVQEHN